MIGKGVSEHVKKDVYKGLGQAVNEDIRNCDRVRSKRSAYMDSMRILTLKTCTYN